MSKEYWIEIGLPHGAYDKDFFITAKDKNEALKIGGELAKDLYGNKWLSVHAYEKEEI